MAAEMMMATISRFDYNRPFPATMSSSFVVRMSSVAALKKMTGDGGGNNKKSINELLLTPRFYTTDFEEIEMLFNTKMNKNLNETEFKALFQEFKTNYNQTHFVRNKEFKQAADMNFPVPTRK